jgi:hypothetical protein
MKAHHLRPQILHNIAEGGVERRTDASRDYRSRVEIGFGIVWCKQCSPARAWADGSSAGERCAKKFTLTGALVAARISPKPIRRKA